MKCVLLVVVAFAAACSASEKLDAYEDINADELAGNSYFLRRIAECLFGDEECTPQTNGIAEVVLGVLQSACAGCNPQAKKNVARLIKAIMDQFPEKWYIYYKQYDPEEASTEELNNFLKENSLNINVYLNDFGDKFHLKFT